MEIRPDATREEIAVIAMNFAKAVGYAVSEALSRGLIKSQAADFLIARTEEFNNILDMGGVLTRLPNGVYVVDNNKKGDKE